MLNRLLDYKLIMFSNFDIELEFKILEVLILAFNRRMLPEVR